MDVIDLMPGVAAHRHEISFRLAGHRSEVACTITREALKAQFWLPGDAEMLTRSACSRHLRTDGAALSRSPNENSACARVNQSGSRPTISRSGSRSRLPSVTRHHQPMRCFSSVSRCRRSSST